MRIAHLARRRSGLTLLEVLVSFAILLAFLTAISQLLNLCTFHALEVQNLNRASQLLQSQMNRVICGEVPLSGQGDTAFDDDADWTWSIDCQADSTPNLWHVTIKVNHAATMAGQEGTWSLDQWVIDPAARGAIQAPATSSSFSSSSSTTPSSGGP
jgi:Tfp pilus assembly protein PilV